MEIAGTAALVTGGASGLGAATARRLAGRAAPPRAHGRAWGVRKRNGAQRRGVAGRLPGVSGARDVTPEQAPQLHGVIDRLCALADMPKPRVAIAETDVPNAFATGRSPHRSAVCVTTGLLRRLDREELEAVLAHELSHVAHRDVTVMTVASFLSVVANASHRQHSHRGTRTPSSKR